MRKVTCGCGAEALITETWQRIYARCSACGSALAIDADDVYVMREAPPPVIGPVDLPQRVIEAREAYYLREHPRFGPIFDPLAAAEQRLRDDLDQEIGDERPGRAYPARWHNRIHKNVPALLDDVATLLDALDETREEIARLEQRLEDSY